MAKDTGSDRVGERRIRYGRDASVAKTTAFKTGGSTAVRIRGLKPGEAVRVVADGDGRWIVERAAEEWPAEFLAALGSHPDMPEIPRLDVVLRDPFA